MDPATEANGQSLSGSQIADASGNLTAQAKDIITGGRFMFVVDFTVELPDPRSSHAYTIMQFDDGSARPEQVITFNAKFTDGHTGIAVHDHVYDPDPADHYEVGRELKAVRDPIAPFVTKFNYGETQPTEIVWNRAVLIVDSVGFAGDPYGDFIGAAMNGSPFRADYLIEEPLRDANGNIVIGAGGQPVMQPYDNWTELLSSLTKLRLNTANANTLPYDGQVKIVSLEAIDNGLATDYVSLKTLAETRSRGTTAETDYNHLFTGKTDAGVVTNAIVGTAEDDLIVGSEVSKAELFSATGEAYIFTELGYIRAGRSAEYDARCIESMAGGAGDDRYWINHRSDTIDDTSGYDIAFCEVSWDASVSVFAGQNIEEIHANRISSNNFVTDGIATDMTRPDFNINLTGNDFDQRIVGMDGRNVLSGRGGDDLLFGYAGADRLLGGLGDDELYGGTDGDFLNGNEGADILDGASGNDTYQVEDAADTVVELAAAGTDTVNALVSYALTANVEILNLIGAGAINGTGNELANVIAGNLADNFIDGLAGADTMWGGGGDDIYVVENLGDAVQENAGEGEDTVRAAISYTLTAEVEVLVLTGADIDGTGNALANTILGSAGNNQLIGAGSDDYLIAGLGDDIVNGGAGSDTADYADAVGTGVVVSLGIGGAQSVGGGLGSDTLIGIENLVGSDFTDALIGNNLNNLLNGGLGSDRMSGGLGNDIYIVESAGDLVIESAGFGFDEVRTLLGYYSLASVAHVERLTFIAMGRIIGRGNELDNRLVGGLDDDRFITDAGGADRYLGDFGFDTMDFRQSAAGVTIDLTTGVHGGAAAGDYFSSIDAFYGSDTAADTMIGNTSNNRFDGYGGNDVLDGGIRNDTLYGGAGDDTIIGGRDWDYLSGGLGADTFIILSMRDSGLSASLRDRILDFQAGIDKIDLSALDADTATGGDDPFTQFIGGSAFTAAGQIRVFQSGANAVIELNTTGASDAEMQIQLTNFSAASLTVGDFVL
jgi:Ca2+-binding RTX toxin-like protein